MSTKTYSQTSRDRMVANLIIALPVLAALGLIRYYQASTQASTPL